MLNISVQINFYFDNFYFGNFISMIQTLENAGVKYRCILILISKTFVRNYYALKTKKVKSIN